MMMRAVWNGAVLAESDDTVVVEGNHYFPPELLAGGYLVMSEHRLVCPWKGVTSYRSLSVDGVVNLDASWEYDSPLIAVALSLGDPPASSGPSLRAGDFPVGIGTYNLLGGAVLLIVGGLFVGWARAPRPPV